jgi:hypothetical protein
MTILPFAAVGAIAYWYVGRTRPPPVAPDLRRADDAQLLEVPTQDEVRDRIADAFGETEPVN